jgi:hypothetical protein
MKFFRFKNARHRGNGELYRMGLKDGTHPHSRNSDLAHLPEYQRGALEAARQAQASRVLFASRVR